MQDEKKEQLVSTAGALAVVVVQDISHLIQSHLHYGPVNWTVLNYELPDQSKSRKY